MLFEMYAPWLRRAGYGVHPAVADCALHTATVHPTGPTDGATRVPAALGAFLVPSTSEQQVLDDPLQGNVYSRVVLMQYTFAPLEGCKHNFKHQTFGIKHRDREKPQLLQHHTKKETYHSREYDDDVLQEQFQAQVS